MIRITINNYQYWYNKETEKLYLDEEGTNEVAKRSFNVQEMTQFYSELNKKVYSVEEYRR